MLERWRRYWFDDGGRYAIAMVRIAIAIAVLVVLDTLGDWHLVVEHGYRPIGPWMLLGDWQPTAGVVAVLRVIAWASTIAMLLGIASRVTTAISFVTSLALVCLLFSSSLNLGQWSHGHNVVFLAQLALLGGRCGDALSVDASIRRLRRRPAIDVARGYQWSLRLVQLAVALMFIGAGVYKLAGGGFSLAWATSDNLRHQLLIRYDLADIARPAIVDWLLQESWRYRGAAILNLISQLAPILAIAMPRRPYVRAVVAALFVAEVIAIDKIMMLGNPQWFPLVAVFIDWDRLFAWIARRIGRPVVPPTRADVTAPRPSQAPSQQVFIIAFVLYDSFTTFVPRVDQKLGTYPFTSFPLFARIRAQQPYSEHLPYVVPTDRFTCESERPISPELDRWLVHANRRLYNVVDPRRLQEKLETLLTELQIHSAWFGIRSIRHYLALAEAPAYPAEPRLEIAPIAITGEAGPGGFRTVLGTWTRNRVELGPQNVDVANVRLVYYDRDTTKQHDLPATRAGNTFTFHAPLPEDAAHIVAIVDGEAWLAASMRSRR